MFGSITIFMVTEEAILQEEMCLTVQAGEEAIIPQAPEITLAMM